MDYCDLNSVPFFGFRYKWDNKREGDAFIQERMDYVLANQKWLDTFPETNTCHLPRDGSDHSPISLCCYKEDVETESPSPRPFRFEAMWIDHEDCADIIQGACGHQKVSWVRSIDAGMI